MKCPGGLRYDDPLLKDSFNLIEENISPSVFPFLSVPLSFSPFLSLYLFPSRFCYTVEEESCSKISITFSWRDRIDNSLFFYLPLWRVPDVPSFSLINSYRKGSSEYPFVLYTRITSPTSLGRFLCILVRELCAPPLLAGSIEVPSPLLKKGGHQVLIVLDGLGQVIL